MKLKTEVIQGLACGAAEGFLASQSITSVHSRCAGAGPL